MINGPEPDLDEFVAAACRTLLPTWHQPAHLTQAGMAAFELCRSSQLLAGAVSAYPLANRATLTNHLGHVLAVWGVLAHSCGLSPTEIMAACVDHKPKDQVNGACHNPR